MVSSQILSTAVDWLAKEDELMKIDRRSPKNWLLHRAQVPKAWVPTIDLHDLQFAAADFSNSNVSYVSFSDASLEGSQFLGTNMFGSRFEKLTLRAPTWRQYEQISATLMDLICKAPILAIRVSVGQAPPPPFSTKPSCEGRILQMQF